MKRNKKEEICHRKSLVFPSETVNYIIKIMDKIKWYMQYAWVKLNIWVLTPIVWVQSKYDEYKEWRLRTYVQYQIAMSEMSKK